MAPDFRAGGAPVKASSQRGSASLCGSSDNATASTNVTSSPLAVPAVIAASPWSSTPERDRYTTRPQARGRPENQGTWRQLDALSQLAAEAEGGSDAEQRQGANLSSKGQPPQTKVLGR